MATTDPLPLQILLTPEGYLLLQAELEDLTEVRLPAAARRMHDALELGDRDDDAQLADARREHDAIEGRIQRLEGQLRAARVLAPADLARDRVAIGHAVEIRRGDGAISRYVLVSAAESNPREGRLSSDSPLGRAVLGRGPGDTVVVDGTDEHITIVGFRAA